MWGVRPWPWASEPHGSPIPALTLSDCGQLPISPGSLCFLIWKWGQGNSLMEMLGGGSLKLTSGSVQHGLWYRGGVQRVPAALSLWAVPQGGHQWPGSVCGP